MSAYYDMLEKIGAGIGGAMTGYQDQQAANRKVAEQRALAAWSQGDTKTALEWAAKAHPDSDLPVAPRKTKQVDVAAPGVGAATTPEQMAKMTGPSQQRQLGVTPVAQMGFQPNLGNAAGLPTLGGAPAAGPAPTMAAPLGASAKDLPSLVPKTVSVSEDAGPDYSNAAFNNQVGAFLGQNKPAPAYQKVDGVGLVAATPTYGNQPGSVKVAMPEQLSPYERAKVLLEKAGQDLTSRGQDLSYKAQMSGDQTRMATTRMQIDADKWIASLRANTDLKQSNIAAGAKGASGSGYIDDDKARAMAAIANALKDPMTGEVDVTMLNKALAAYHLPTFDAVPGAEPTPDPATASPTPGPTPPPYSPPSAYGAAGAAGARQPGAPTPQPSFAPLANGTEPGPKPITALVDDFKTTFGENYVSSVQRDRKGDAAKGRDYDSYHHHNKAFDSTPPLPAMPEVIKWGVERGARVLIEGDHIHMEPSTTGRGYVEVKKGAVGPYADAYQTNHAPKGQPNGATSRIKGLLNRTKPKEQ